MSWNEVKNVLVLGNTGVDILKFAKLFGAYLQYNSYEEALKSQPNLTETEGNHAYETTRFFVGDTNLICAHNLEKSFTSKQVLSVLNDFAKGKSLTAIIILQKFDWNHVDYIKKLEGGLLSKLKEFKDNILYIYALDANCYKYQQIVLEQAQIFQTKSKNIFYYQENIFYNTSGINWEHGAYLCQSINNYINSLQKFNVRSVIPTKSLLNVIDNILVFLIQSYINSVRPGQTTRRIVEYKRNVTACYSKQCIQILKDVIVPKICHASCNCKSNNASNCIIFANKTCIQCNCSSSFHCEIYFKYHYIINSSMNGLNFLVEVFAVLFNYKKKNLAEDNFEATMLKIFDWEDDKSIHDTFKLNFDELVKKYENSRITNDNIVQYLLYIFQIFSVDDEKIFSQFFEEIFPTDFKLEITQENMGEFSEQSSSTSEVVEDNTSCKTPEIHKDISENQLLRNEIETLNCKLDQLEKINSKLDQLEKINSKLDQLLSLNKNILLRENPNSNKNPQASSSNVKLNES